MGKNAADWLSGTRPTRQIRLRAGQNVRYTAPSMLAVGFDGSVSLRPLVVRNDAKLLVSCAGRTLREKRLSHIQPSEMLHFALNEEELELAAGLADDIEISIQ